jgi:hypothetical protein
MSKNNGCDSDSLDRLKGHVGKIVTGQEPKLPAKNRPDPRIKHTIWIDFKRVKLDGRTALARKINSLRRELIEHVGGKPSIVESLLIERMVHKAIKAFLYETNYYSEKDQGSEDHYYALVASLRRDCVALGLKKSERKLLDLNELHARAKKEPEK